MKLPGLSTVRLPALSKREVILVLLVFLASTTFFCYKFIFKPQWNEVKKLRAELDRQKQELDFRIKEGWNDISDLKARCEEIERQIKIIHMRVPNIKNEPQLLVDFYKTAKANNVMAETVKFSELKEVEGKNYSTFTVSTEVTGPTVNIYNFIKDIEEYPRLNRISEIKFEPQSSTWITCSLTVEFYVLHEVKPDPLDYPFMEGEYGKDRPYQIFGVYGQGEEKAPQEPGGNGAVPAEPAQALSTREGSQLTGSGLQVISVEK